MGKAARRARKNENKRMAQEARERAERNRKTRKVALRVGIAVVVFGLIAGLLYTLAGDDDDNDVATDNTTPDTSEPTDSTTATPSSTLPPLVKTECNDTTPEAPEPKTYTEAPETEFDAAKFYIATIETSCGTMVAELDAAKAPVATKNFVALARDGFYDGLKWHRVMKEFMIQGGDPNGDGSGGPGYSVAGEPPTDNYFYGSLAAAKTASDPAGTMGSQFFVVTGDQGVALPNDYARFGILTSGLDVARTLADFQADGAETPTRELFILKVTITESATSTTTTAAPETTTTSAAPAETTTSTAPADTTTTVAP